MSNFEQQARARLNARALMLLGAHVPVCAAFALWQGSSFVLAFLVGILLLAGPAALFITGSARLSTSISIGISSMGFSALIIHLGHGMIEMHFHIFAVLALLTVFGSVWPVIAAAATIAVHHLAFWMWLPASVFNYQAGLGIVVTHAFFVVFETLPACYIAMQFGRAIRNQIITREQLEGSALRVHEAATAIATEGRQLALRASEQAATLQDTLRSSAEISASGDRLAANSRDAMMVIEQADDRISRANEILESLDDSITQMSSSSKQIEKIIQVINVIAFQTNILALNAAVEAAHAGAAGQGFAVVADEVRNLAQQCGTAAQETAQLLTNSAVTAQTSAARMQEISLAMDKVTESSVSVRQLVQGAAETGQQQAFGIAQISNALSRLEKLTGLTEATAEENASVGASLQEDAQQLSGIIALLSR